MHKRVSVTVPVVRKCRSAGHQPKFELSTGTIRIAVNQVIEMMPVAAR
jgi:hypothetical protein